MIFILNCGSQSIKWKLFTDDLLNSERITRSEATGLKLKKEGKQKVFDSKKYQQILTKELKKLENYKKKIKVIGHRVVHGGNKFKKPTRINKRVLKELEKFNKFAPLHNPFNILGIKTAQKFFSKIPQIAVFDTEFYTDLPQKAYVYPLPENLRKKYGFRHFGFHGISHEYVAKTAAKKIKRPFEKLKIITCHLGGGASITAIKNGRAIDTSMGFTPMEGVVMMTRSGDIDPGIVLELSKIFSPSKTEEILNFESGLKGISGSGNMLEILKRAKRGNQKAKLALRIFTYRIQKCIGAYFAILRGCDLLVFTGAIGSGSRKIRNMICKDLNILKNTKILSVETNEELAIAHKI